MWLKFYIHTALVSGLNQETMAEIWGFFFSLLSSQKVQKNSTKLYLSNYINKLQNWNLGSKRSAGATPLNCPLGFLLLRDSEGAPRNGPGTAECGVVRGPGCRDGSLRCGSSLSFMTISEGMGRTWRRSQNVFEGGNNKGWMGGIQTAETT